MQRKLFTKLQQSSFKTQSEQVVHSIVENILERTNQMIRIQTIKKNSTKILVSQIMRSQMHSIHQAYRSDPCCARLNEDMGNNTRIKQHKRPFSTKIQYHQTYLPSSKKSLYNNSRSSSRYSRNMSFSHLSKVERKHGFARPEPKKFIPLPNGQQQQINVFEKNEENALRIKKNQQIAYYKSLEQFQMKAKNESEKNLKINIKIAQIMGNKSFYYNKNGQNIEIAPKKILKKVTNKRQVRKSQNIKKQIGQINSQSLVGYNSTETSFKKARNTFKLDDKPPMLFYKSQNCKYQIIPF